MIPLTKIYSQAKQVVKKRRDKLRDEAMQRMKDKVRAILAAEGSPDTSRSEHCFDKLQAAYEPLPEYGYDVRSLWRRAAERSVTLLALPEMDKPGKRILEVGAGDGTLGVLLNAFGHSTTLVDQEDWRCDMAKGVQFQQADCSLALPFPDGHFDLVYSYNSFEHFPEPQLTMSEMTRVARPGASLYVEFGPLFASPWGLHAYRSLKMPYPQFLFSEDFIKAKLNEIGIWDLGRKRTELQYLNRWKVKEFSRLWKDSRLTVDSEKIGIHEGNLDLVLEHPSAFRGRQLTIEDLISANMSVTLRRTR
jgi:ubiquinone/menaquinone biosynthesis C-methylase UbiE